MNFIRNSEVKAFIFICLLISAISSAISFANNFTAGIVTVISCITITIVSIVFSLIRYKRIAQFSETIDRLLHNEENINLNKFDEGELAILNNEVTKLTVKLREQSDRLIKDKTYLADSIADISHQLRTPLTSMNLVASMLTEADLTYERRRVLVKELEKSLSRIDWQITALLKISKLDAGTAHFDNNKVNISELIKKAVEPIEISMDLRDQNFEVNIQESASFIGDISWTAEAITNILKNCMEHTPNGGKISVLAQENPLFSEIEICDTGEGIDKNDLPHLFERFYKGKNSSAESVGIGLALARMIINEQKGIIKAENRINGGSKFNIRFYKSTL